jgi:hypothetical protein
VPEAEFQSVAWVPKAVADIAGDIRKGRGAGKEWKRLLG